MSLRIRKPATQTDSEPVASHYASEAAAGTAPPASELKAATTSSASSVRKEPPPEKPSDIRRRTYVILSFWALIVSIGLPIWWHTTSVYRADLPLDNMMEWADGRACSPVFPLQIALKADSASTQEAKDLIQLTQSVLDNLNDSPAHQLRLQLAQEADATDERTALTVHLTPGEATSTSLHLEKPVLDVTYAPNELPSPPLATAIATQLRAVFAEEQGVISALLSDAFSSEVQTRVSESVASAVARRSTRSLRYAPTYHLTFSLFTAGAAPSSWDIDAALERYMRPMLDVLSPIHNFTIDTQVQLYAVPGVQAEVLRKEDLSSFINAAEWPLSPSIGGAPTVNFVVYVGNHTISLPASDGESPATTSQSWLIPQWGTVYLAPHTAGGDAHVAADALRAPMLTFTAHLLSLLGTPQSGSLPLRLSALSRIRSAELLLRASSTLGSLARLSLALPGIAIPRSVAEGVATTLGRLRLACDGLGTGAGLEHARIAEQAAERAFFEKSMVGQLYFPDEHKMAVYMPLLGPVGVPLVLGLLNELRGWKKRRQERAAAEKAGKKTE